MRSFQLGKMTGATWALRTAPIVYLRPSPYSDIEMTLTGVDVRLHRKHVEPLTAAKYLQCTNISILDLSRSRWVSCSASNNDRLTHYWQTSIVSCANNSISKLIYSLCINYAPITLFHFCFIPRPSISCLANRLVVTAVITFFASQVVPVWNSLPSNIVNFSTLSKFKTSLFLVDLSKFLKYQLN